MIYLIGCGGVGSWAAPAMCLLMGAKNITLVDGDVLEKKNLNRQLFTDRDIGSNKAEALARKYGCAAMPEWFSESLISLTKHDWLLGLVDNHPGRRSVLNSVDFSGCRAICAANETHSSEAFVYLPQWRDTALDPRVMYPEINSNTANDPRARGIGCTGEAQADNVQLVTANFMAAALLTHLFVVWAMESRKLKQEDHKFLPHKLVNNLTRNETYKVGEPTEEKTCQITQIPASNSSSHLIC